MSRKISRRNFLKVSALTAAGAAAGIRMNPAIASSAPPGRPTAPAQQAMQYKEAPMLAELVKTGKLPAVDQRLPKNPLVVQPVESVGKYGGTWRRGWRGINDFHTFGRTVYEPMLRWPRDPADAIQPGLAEKWEWSSDGKVLTLHLREGLKWSDGAPFTVDDIIFWWEAIETDTNVTKVIHPEWVVNGKPMELEKVSDTVINLKFDAPNGLAEGVGLAFHGNQWPLGFERFGFFAPKHYLSQFHPKFTASGDYKVFEQMANEYNVERPAMTAWRIVQYKAGDTEMLVERNPYYWKVDPEGQQLPYIDRGRYFLLENAEAVNLKAIAGELDMEFRATDLAKYTVYQENAEKGDYHVILWPQAQASGAAIFLNQSFADMKYRELFQNFKFRQALSVAIDRSTINSVSFLDQAKPRTATVVPGAKEYEPDLETLNAEFDQAKANTLLDELGLKKSGEFRAFADGSPLKLVIETMDTGGYMLDAWELVAENFKAVGLNTEIKSMTRDIYWPKATTNEVMVATWSLDRGLTPMIDPIYQFPFDERSWMAPAFAVWYKTGGKSGEEPSAEFKEAMSLYDQYKGTTDPAKQLEYAKKIVRMASEGLWCIGTCGMVPQLVVLKNYFKNVPESHVSDWLIMSPGTTDPSQYWMDV